MTREVGPAFLIVGAAALLVSAGLAAAQLGPVPVPPGNPITEPKRILGKVLFWDEQLSSDNTMSCGTCHTTRGGSDLRRVRTVGPDGSLNSPDDVFGSPGVIRSDANNEYLRSTAFGFAPQVTGRNSMTFLMAAYAPTNFWDGRANGTFADPLTGQTLIPNGAALENQAVGPPLSSVEMAHDSRDWASVSSKLQGARPMAAATNLTADMAAVINAGTTYGDLFQAAFGSPTVTPARIAMAIATYERTVIPNDTPWDRFIAGNTNALTQGQRNGLQTFNAQCAVCHASNNGQFTNNTFRNIGLRPPAEDLGRQIVTGNVNDRGRFKVPSLRNVGLRTSFMHNGMFATVPEVVAFYARAPGAPQQFPDNRDPAMGAINLPPQAANALTDFLVNGLTDARVANQTFPFDKPTLYSERPVDRPAILAGGNAGSGGIVPAVIAADPPFVGNAGFRVGLMNARGGATARVLFSQTAPVSGVLQTGELSAEVTLGGTGNGQGFGTMGFPIGANGLLSGRTYYYQWLVNDPAAVGGVARSNIARVTFFCGGGGCPPACVADYDLSGFLTPDDLADYIACYFSAPACDRSDIDGNGATDPDDLADFISLFFGGCAT
jgi:cytochrome c peroxidase